MYINAAFFNSHQNLLLSFSFWMVTRVWDFTSGSSTFPVTIVFLLVSHHICWTQNSHYSWKNPVLSALWQTLLPSVLFEIDGIPHLGIQLLKYWNNPFSFKRKSRTFKDGQWCGNANLLFCCSGVNTETGDKDSERSVNQLPEEY